MKRKVEAKALAVALGTAAALVTLGAVHASAFAQGTPAGGAGDGDVACSAAVLSGAYGFTATGTLNGVGPVARVGRAVFDGRGHASGTATTSLNGSVFSSTHTITYTVKPDCTGTATEVDSILGTVHDNTVVVDGGRGIEAIAADQGGTITAAWKKQFPPR